MIKKSIFVPGSAPKNTGLITLLCMILLGTAACGGLPSNSLTPTPTTQMGYLQPDGQSAGESIPSGSLEAGSTETPAPDHGDKEDLVDICGLVSQPDAEAVLHQSVTAINPGVDQDSNTGGTLYFCTYLGKGLAVVITLEDLGTTMEAEQALEQQLTKMQADDPGVTSTQENDPGDKAYWTTSENAVQYTVLKDKYVFSVMLGGNIGDPAAHKADLLALAEVVAANL